MQQQKQDSDSDRLEGQRPCQGGRYREFPNGDVIIQCNCNFFCTSAVDSKTRERKVQPKLPDGQSYPYYYECPEKDKIPNWSPWHSPEEDSKKAKIATTTSSPKTKLLALSLMAMLCTLSGIPVAKADAEEGAIETTAWADAEMPIDSCVNPDSPLRTWTEFDTVRIINQLKENNRLLHETLLNGTCDPELEWLEVRLGHISESVTRQFEERERLRAKIKEEDDESIKANDEQETILWWVWFKRQFAWVGLVMIYCVAFAVSVRREM